MLRKTFVAVMICALYFLPAAHAAPTITMDPDFWQRYEEKLRWFGGKTLKFEEAFQCGDQATFRSPTESCDYDCNRIYCLSKCVHPDPELQANTFYVEDCSQDRVSIYSDTGLAIEVTKEDYASAQTWFLTLLKSSGHFLRPEGRLHLNSFVFPETYQLKDGTGKKSISALRIKLDYYPNPGKASTPMELKIAPSAPGVMQILEFRSDFGQDSSFFYLEEVPGELRTRLP